MTACAAPEAPALIGFVFGVILILYALWKGHWFWRVFTVVAGGWFVISSFIIVGASPACDYGSVSDLAMLNDIAGFLLLIGIPLAMIWTSWPTSNDAADVQESQPDEPPI